MIQWRPRAGRHRFAALRRIVRTHFVRRSRGPCCARTGLRVCRRPLPSRGEMDDIDARLRSGAVRSPVGHADGRKRCWPPASSARRGEPRWSNTRRSRHYMTERESGACGARDASQLHRCGRSHTGPARPAGGVASRPTSTAASRSVADPQFPSCQHVSGSRSVIQDDPLTPRDRPRRGRLRDVGRTGFSSISARARRSRTLCSSPAELRPRDEASVGRATAARRAGVVGSPR